MSIKQRVRSVLQQGMLALSAPVAAGLARLMKGNEAYQVFEPHGYHLLKKHYYLPIPDENDLTEEHWNFQSELVGVDLRLDAAMELLDNEIAPYLKEFSTRFPLDPPANGRGFHLLNSSFMAVDAHIYYSFIRCFKPARIVEIGSGNSTVLALAACLENQKEGGTAPRLTAIEPYPPASLKNLSSELLQIIPAKVQSVDMELFTSLRAGDILFIDSTHVLREAGDVWWEFCEILPRLSSGVLVHIHDVSLPKPYPRVYMEEKHYYWNEQYLLQAFLSFNSRFEVIWPGNALMLKHPARMRAAFPEFDAMRARYPASEPASFWMRVV